MNIRIEDLNFTIIAHTFEAFAVTFSHDFLPFSLSFSLNKYSGNRNRYYIEADFYSLKNQAKLPQ